MKKEEKVEVQFAFDIDTCIGQCRSPNHLEPIVLETAGFIPTSSLQHAARAFQTSPNELYEAYYKYRQSAIPDTYPIQTVSFGDVSQRAIAKQRERIIAMNLKLLVGYDHAG